MKVWWMLMGAMLLQVQSAGAAIVCVTVPAPGVPVHLRQAIAYSVIFGAGQNQVPTLTGDNVCLVDPTINLAIVLTNQTMLDRYTQAANENQVVLAQSQALFIESQTLETDVDTAFTNWSSLTAAQRIDALRKSMRLNRVYRRLGTQ